MTKHRDQTPSLLDILEIDSSKSVEQEDHRYEFVRPLTKVESSHLANPWDGSFVAARLVAGSTPVTPYKVFPRFLNTSESVVALQWKTPSQKIITAPSDGYSVWHPIPGDAQWLPKRWKLPFFPVGWSAEILRRWSLAVEGVMTPQGEKIDAESLWTHAKLANATLHPKPSPRAGKSIVETTRFRQSSDPISIRCSEREGGIPNTRLQEQYLHFGEFRRSLTKSFSYLLALIVTQTPTAEEIAFQCEHSTTKSVTSMVSRLNKRLDASTSSFPYRLAIRLDSRQRGRYCVTWERRGKK